MYVSYLKIIKLNVLNKTVKQIDFIYYAYICCVLTNVYYYILYRFLTKNLL